MVGDFVKSDCCLSLPIGIFGVFTRLAEFRHNGLRTGAQLNHCPLTDPAKVATLHVGWTFPIAPVNPAPGPFRAGPIIYKGVVYIGNSNGHLYAIDANTGALKWEYPAANAQALVSTFTCNPSSE